MSMFECGCCVKCDGCGEHFTDCGEGPDQDPEEEGYDYWLAYDENQVEKWVKIFYTDNREDFCEKCHECEKCHKKGLQKMTKYEELKKKVEATVFYGCGDEAYELWSAMCALCYKCAGLGETEKAEVLVQWIIDMAEENKKWYIEEFGDVDEEDSEKGYWGY